MSIEEHQLEKYSSAVTLSDMEIFVFPEIFYALVLANIMSPAPWAWRDHPWFKKIDEMTPYRKILRLKQFIVDHFEFNLDLDTWGLTRQEREIERFAPFMDRETIAESNALFGYTGDQYYFDIDIRRHFGLDRYGTDTIPYWKTETAEAMQAFRHREGYREGAGECVSLSTLYAAALFVVCRIPLDDIFLMATPLHSQNFILVRDGVITNNRRVVTRNMWYNGTELTARAQRALRHERVTMVAHNTGLIHTVYENATIDRDAYRRFHEALRAFLCQGEVDMNILGSFLRQHRELHSCFQIVSEAHGHTRYLPAEKAYAYEVGSSYRVDDNSRDRLLDSIDEYEFFSEPIGDRIVLNTFEEFFRHYNVRLDDEDSLRRMVEVMDCPNARTGEIIEKLVDFCCIRPRLPDPEKKSFDPVDPIVLDPDADRDAIVERLDALRTTHPVADLAFYAYRDLARCDDWRPFLIAAIERNPVIAEALADADDDGARRAIRSLEDESIYGGDRAAQPDEVWNFGRGDGFEKALALAALWARRHPDEEMRISMERESVLFQCGPVEERFPSKRSTERTVRIGPGRRFAFD
jgi:hypothetical protein